MNAKRIRIYGRVQGVGYRAWAVSQGTLHGLSGWVRNRSDGSVEAQLQGDVENIHQMIEACRKGPLSAHVTDIEISDSGYERLSAFSHRATV